MLKRVELDNFAIFYKEQVSFSKGLNAITGETGSGKSILLDALIFVLGTNKSSDFVGPKSETCNVSLVFSNCEDLRPTLKEIDLDFQKELTLRRSYNLNSKSGKYFIEGVLVSAGQAKQVLLKLLDVTTQHENNKLFDLEYQLRFYDDLIELSPKVKEYFGVFQEWQRIQKDLNFCRAQEEGSLGKIEYLQFQLEEFERIQPKAREDEQLEEQIKNLQFKNTKTDRLQELNTFINEEPGISKFFASFKKDFSFDIGLSKSLESTLSEVNNLSENLSKILEGTDTQSVNLEDLEQRRDELFKIISKNGRTLERALQSWGQIKSELNDLHLIPKKREHLEKELKEVEKKLQLKVEFISKERLKHKASVERKINKVLKDLEMKEVNFQFSFEPLETFGPFGMERIEFQINTTGKMSSLKSIASGGELSRVLLALKSLHCDGEINVFVFDEIDSALGGVAATSVGRKLKELSANSQVLCVTHHAQVSSFADYHILVEKKSKQEANARVLNTSERIEELSRMLGGKKDASNIMKKAAKDLLESAAMV